MNCKFVSLGQLCLIFTAINELLCELSLQVQEI